MFKESEKIPFAGNQPGQHLSGMKSVMPDGIDSISFKMEVSEETEEAGPQTYIWIYAGKGEERTPVAMLSSFSDLDEICAAIVARQERGLEPAKIELTDGIAYHNNSRVDADENAEEGGVTCAKASVEHLAGNLIVKFTEPGRLVGNCTVENEIGGIFVPIDKVMVDQIIEQFSDLRLARRDEINRLHTEKLERQRAAAPTL